MSDTSWDPPEPVTTTPETPLEPAVDSVEHKFRLVHEVYLNGAERAASVFTTALHDTDEFVHWARAHEHELEPLGSMLARFL
jgi:hypothetical protein